MIEIESMDLEQISKALPATEVLDSPNPHSERPEWLEFRRGMLGGSDVAAALGLSPWQTPIELWAEKTGMVPGGLDDHIRLRMGNYMEDFIASEFFRETGLVAKRCLKTIKSPAVYHIGVSLDYLVFEPGRDEPIGVLECKTTAVGAMWDEGIPVNYQAQAQAQLLATDLERCWFGVLMFPGFGPARFETFELERSDEDINTIVNHTGEFWDRFVVTGQMPTPEYAQTTAEMAQIFGEAKHKGEVVIEDSEEAARVAAVFLNASEQIKVLEEAKRVSQMKLMEHIGEYAAARLSDGTKLSFIRTRALDADEVLERLGEMSESYIRRTEALDTPKFKKEQKALYEELARVKSGHIRAFAPKK